MVVIDYGADESEWWLVAGAVVPLSRLSKREAYYFTVTVILGSTTPSTLNAALTRARND